MGIGHLGCDCSGDSLLPHPCNASAQRLIFRNLFDAPRAFGCALTVEGLDLWQNGSPPLDARGTLADGTPFQLHATVEPGRSKIQISFR